jgi:hypothetical protein
MNVLAFTKAPKTLPWLAHKAGIDNRRAETLWRTALRHAARDFAPDTPEYWQAAMNRLQDLLTAESRHEDLASFGWRPWARSMADFFVLRRELLDDMTLAGLRAWRILGQHNQPRLLH